MPAIITCSCGARVRVPEQAGAKAFRCPRCKSEIDLIQARAVETASVAQAGGAVCPICQTVCAEADAVVGCPSCEQIHHRECWEEIGGCSTYGCEHAPAAVKNEPSAMRRAGWGDTKTCPVCGETIKSIALRCRYCRTEFDTVDPMTAGDLRRADRRQQELASLRKITTVLFILSLIPFISSIVLILDLAILLPKREALRRAGPTYLVMAYFAIGVSALFSILLLMLFMAD